MKICLSTRWLDKSEVGKQEERIHASPTVFDSREERQTLTHREEGRRKERKGMKKTYKMKEREERVKSEKEQMREISKIVVEKSLR